MPMANLHKKKCFRIPFCKMFIKYKKGAILHFTAFVPFNYNRNKENNCEGKNHPC